jgi:hypothetical protein
VRRDGVVEQWSRGLGVIRVGADVNAIRFVDVAVSAHFNARHASDGQFAGFKSTTGIRASCPCIG